MPSAGTRSRSLDPLDPVSKTSLAVVWAGADVRHANMSSMPLLGDALDDWCKVRGAAATVAGAAAMTSGTRVRPARPTAAASDVVGQEAIAAARVALTARPDDPRALFTLTALLLRAGDPAAAALLPRLDHYRNYAGGWLSIGEALLGLGRAEASLAAIGRAMRALQTQTTSSEVQSGRAHHLLGRALRAAGRDAEAATAFEAGVGLNPSHAEGWYSLAVLHQDLGRDAEAATVYRSALDARPDFHEAAFNLGIALCECGRIEEALDAYAQALALRPDSFGRIAQALVSGRTGLLFLDPDRLRSLLRDRLLTS